MRQTARRLWGVYVGFTVVLALAYIAAGMSLYDGVAHSFTTVSTGGFSPYNASLGHFDSGLIEWIAIVAMFVAGSSFTLIYRLIRGHAGPLLHSKESHLYSLTVVTVAGVFFVVNDATGSVADRTSTVREVGDDGADAARPARDLSGHPGAVGGHAQAPSSRAANLNGSWWFVTRPVRSR